ncbi:SDR family NAD(P)-dependent oxidoreductase [Mangrovihabitans endophyticus]|uniref:Short-chain dehydrogenase n=1 Tax=Mangrovihabitans endophyticus TaxID=1751298 RepID=A0A8J3C5Z8_9ACTN|nr:SDR family NAD(P)-dependent oxidoreductase [Mangrovihabitans endophyticus]GGL13025.1 short-chain dehydrogenase [Mangrovihabitans endophyticus]
MNRESQSAKTVVITGASDGMGAAAARRLVQQGHRVVVVGRSEEKTRSVARDLGAEHLTADFARLDDVRTLAAHLRARHPRINVLANNAGAMFGPRTETVDGFELTFQVNYLAPFLLTNLLLEALTAGRATVIQTTSNAARLSAHLDPDDLNNEHRYSPVRAYGNAKQALVLFTEELDRRYRAQGIAAVAFHPGAIASNFAQNSRSPIGTLFRSPLPRLAFASPDRAARRLVWLATSEPGESWTTGGYYETGKPRTVKSKVAPRDLWERSAALLART